MSRTKQSKRSLARSLYKQCVASNKPFPRLCPLQECVANKVNQMYSAPLARVT